MPDVATLDTAARDAALHADWVEEIAASADRAAFARLFAYFGPRVKAYLIRLGVSPDQAEDLTVEVMAAVWRRAAAFDRREATVTTWVFRIARNLRLESFRRGYGAAA